MVSVCLGRWGGREERCVWHLPASSSQTTATLARVGSPAWQIPRSAKWRQCPLQGRRDHAARLVCRLKKARPVFDVQRRRMPITIQTAMIEPRELMNLKAGWVYAGMRARLVADKVSAGRGRQRSRVYAPILGGTVGEYALEGGVGRRGASACAVALVRPSASAGGGDTYAAGGLRSVLDWPRPSGPLAQGPRGGCMDCGSQRKMS